jgi:alkylation response protein AidB-like acyl-CoA dehydrogenase
MFARALDRALSRRWSDADAADAKAVARAALWSELCDLGLGALGADPAEVPLLVTAMARLGYAAAPVPLIGAATANKLLSGQAECADLLGAVASGEARIAVAFAELDGDPISGRASLADGRLSGLVGAVEDADIATHFLVLCKECSRAALVERGSHAPVAACPGFAVPALSKVTFAGAEARSWPVSPVLCAEAADVARLLLMARAHGAQQRGFELVLDYVRVREQFGQPIGKFQALQHKLADCLLRGDVATLLIEDAAKAFEQPGGAARAVANLVAAAGPGLRQNALEIQHAFGAIGFAEEHEAPRHFKRVHSDATRMGGVRRARRLLASTLFDPARTDPAFPVFEGAAIAELRAQIRAWLAKHWSAEHQAASRRLPSAARDVDMAFLSALAGAGMLSANWPRDVGGGGFGAQEQLALIEELRLAGAPISIVSPSSWLVAPAIIAFGTDEMRETLLPAIAGGKMTFCLGYSEPQAGSDLAALTTRAERDGEDYVINGQKIWTSLAEIATHVFLAARTGSEGKHGGVSMFIVPLDTPGISVRLMPTLHGKTFANVFYDNVRIPAAMRVGAENEGWKILTSALAAERVLMGGIVASLRRIFEGLVEVVRGRRAMAEDPVMLEVMGGLSAELVAARALALRSIALVEAGRDAMIEGAMTKLYSGDLAERIAEAALDLFGVEAALTDGAEEALLHGEVNQHLRTALMLVIGGGTPEIQRNLIAQRRLGLPR